MDGWVGGYFIPTRPPGITLSNDAKFAPAVKVQGWERNLGGGGGGGISTSPFNMVELK